MREIARNSSGDRKMDGRWTDTGTTGKRSNDVPGAEFRFRNPEPGTRNLEPGTRNPEPGTWNYD
jgi:hypothetical protein